MIDVFVTIYDLEKPEQYVMPSDHQSDCSFVFVEVDIAYAMLMYLQQYTTRLVMYITDQIIPAWVLLKSIIIEDLNLNEFG
jgi:hypothetical protein